MYMNHFKLEKSNFTIIIQRNRKNWTLKYGNSRIYTYMIIDCFYFSL